MSNKTLGIEKEILEPFFNKERAPLLTVKQEKKLAKKIEDGRRNKLRLDKQLNSSCINEKKIVRMIHKVKLGHDAQREMFNANIGLVVSIAKRYAGKSLNLTLFHLIHEGNLGLLRAIEKVESRDTKFSTYAIGWIKQKIQRAIAQDKGMLSLDNLLAKDDESSLYDKLIEDKKAISPSEDASKNFLCETVNDAIFHLSPDEQIVISMSFGLGGSTVYSPKEIAKKLGLKKEKVKKVKELALRKLKHHLKE